MSLFGPAGRRHVNHNGQMWPLFTMSEMADLWDLVQLPPVEKIDWNPYRIALWSFSTKGIIPASKYYFKKLEDKPELQAEMQRIFREASTLEASNLMKAIADASIDHGGVEYEPDEDEPAKKSDTPIGDNSQPS